MSFRTWLRTWALVGCFAAAAAPRLALADEPSPANVAAARKHFERARTCYEQGAYREAITELELAHALDPSAKDLVFNLGVVHEKLADIDEALKWFRLYTTMDLVPQERERADAYIRRLEGAKREMEEKQAAAPQPPPESPPPPSEPSPPGDTQSAPPNPSTTAPVTTAQVPIFPSPSSPQTVSGKFDGATLTAIGLSAGGVAFGVVMAVKAENDAPTSAYVTGRNGTAVDLQSLQDQAHREAVMADIGFATALVSAVTAAYLYFGRSRIVPAPSAGSATVSAGPLSGGGALVVKGFF